MPRFKEQKTTISSERARLAYNFVQDNPYVITYYFYQRFNLFKKHVITLKFNVIDSQNCYKQQARSSTHSYSLYYCYSVLDPDRELSYDQTAFSIARAAQYQRYYILAIHLNSSLQALLNKRSTLALLFKQITQTFRELFLILTRYYEHRCALVYCL